MGATHVTVTIRNPADPERSWEGLFLVDTGSTAGRNRTGPPARSDRPLTAPVSCRMYLRSEGA